jgi:MFS family permease
VLPAIFGPALAGLIVSTIGWRWVFLSVVVATVPTAAFVLPRIRRIPRPAESRTSRLPYRPTLWALGAAAGLTLVSVGAENPMLLIPGLVAVVVCGPRLLPRGTFAARRGLPAIALVRGLAGAAFLQTDVFIPLLLTRERGLSPALAGLTLTAGAVCWSAGSWFQARQGARLSDAARVRIGLAGIATGVLAAMALVHPSVPVVAVVIGWAVGGFGMGLVSPALSALVLRVSAPGEQGVNSSALQIADALLTTVALAAGGAAFAALVGAGAPAYLSAFGIGLALAVAGLAAAGRLSTRTLDGDGAPARAVALAGDRAGAGGR